LENNPSSAYMSAIVVASLLLYAFIQSFASFCTSAVMSVFCACRQPTWR
jgi:hypothetical protein